jgi:hypothetical protein
MSRELRSPPRPAVILSDPPSLCLTCTKRSPAPSEKAYGRCGLTGETVGAAQTCPLYEPKPTERKHA